MTGTDNHIGPLEAFILFFDLLYGYLPVYVSNYAYPVDLNAYSVIRHSQCFIAREISRQARALQDIFPWRPFL